MNKKNPKRCECKTHCKATAALNKETAEEMEQEDKPLQELLDEKQPESEKQ